MAYPENHEISRNCILFWHHPGENRPTNRIPSGHQRPHEKQVFQPTESVSELVDFQSRWRKGRRRVFESAISAAWISAFWRDFQRYVHLTRTSSKDPPSTGNWNIRLQSHIKNTNWKKPKKLQTPGYDKKTQYPPNAWPIFGCIWLRCTIWHADQTRPNRSRPIILILSLAPQ